MPKSEQIRIMIPSRGTANISKEDYRRDRKRELIACDTCAGPT